MVRALAGIDRKMNAVSYDYDDVEDWDEDFQISYGSGKPAPMKSRRKRSISSWQKIEQLKDEALLNKQISQDDFSYYE